MATADSSPATSNTDTLLTVTTSTGESANRMCPLTLVDATSVGREVSSPESEGAYGPAIPRGRSGSANTRVTGTPLPSHSRVLSTSRPPTGRSIPYRPSGDPEINNSSEPSNPMDEDGDNANVNILLAALQQNNIQNNNTIVINYVEDSRTLLMQQNTMLVEAGNIMTSSYEAALAEREEESRRLQEHLQVTQRELMIAYEQDQQKDQLIAQYGSEAREKVTDLLLKNELLQRELEASKGATEHWQSTAKYIQAQGSEKVRQVTESNAQGRAEFGRLSDELAESRKREADFLAKVPGAQKQHDQLWAAKNTADQEIQVLQRNLKQISEKLESAQTAATQYNQECQELRAKLASGPVDQVLQRECFDKDEKIQLLRTTVSDLEQKAKEAVDRELAAKAEVTKSRQQHASEMSALRTDMADQAERFKTSIASLESKIDVCEDEDPVAANHSLMIEILKLLETTDGTLAYLKLGQTELRGDMSRIESQQIATKDHVTELHDMVKDAEKAENASDDDGAESDDEPIPNVPKTEPKVTSKVIKDKGGGGAASTEPTKGTKRCLDSAGDTADLDTVDPTAQTYVIAPVKKGNQVLQVNSTSGFAVGQNVKIEGGGMSEINSILSFGSLILATPLAHDYPPGTTVTATVASSTSWPDIEADPMDAPLVKQFNENKVKIGKLPKRKAEIETFHIDFTDSVLAASGRQDEMDKKFLDVVFTWNKNTPTEVMDKIPRGFFIVDRALRVLLLDAAKKEPYLKRKLEHVQLLLAKTCLLYTSPSPRDS